MKASRKGFIVRGVVALTVSFMVVFALGAGQALAKETFVMSDLGWDSAQVHNRIAGFIIEHGYGYGIELMPGDTVPMFAGLMRGT